jgi:hypothetical protein
MFARAIVLSAAVSVALFALPRGSEATGGGFTSAQASNGAARRRYRDLQAAVDHGRQVRRLVSESRA